MNGYHEGYSFEENLVYCPFCGSKFDSWKHDGTAECPDCFRRFAVIEIEGTD